MIGLAVAGQLFPCGGLINLAAEDGLVHQLGTLRIDLTAAQCVVTYFAVAHIIIRRQTYGRAVSLDGQVRRSGLEFIQSGGRCLLYHIAEGFRRFTHAVHHNQNNGFFHLSNPPVCGEAHCLRIHSIA